jgi:aspartate racemase
MACTIGTRRQPIAGASMVDVQRRKKIGILGGTGWPSTVHYYIELCRRSEALELAADPSISPTTPEMSIESLDLRRAVSLIGTDADESSWRQFDEYHRTGLHRLEGSGADFAVIASNTPHHRYASIVKGVGIPVLNLFEAVARRCRLEGHREMLILGTALTMRSQVLRDAFTAQGIGVSTPVKSDDREAVLSLISKLQRGDSEGTAQFIKALVHNVSGRPLTDPPAVCLACTELPLAFPAQLGCATFDCDGVQYVNSSVVHIEAALALASSAGITPGID